MPSENNPKGRVKEFVVQESEKELLIYDMKNHKAFCLNETSALVWQMCDGQTNISDIAQRLSRKLGKFVPDDFIRLALDELRNQGLLDKPEQSYLNGMTRREAARRIGFAAMIALPLISSIVAPPAASAASCTLAQPGEVVTSFETSCGFCAALGRLCCSNIIREPSVCSPLNSGVRCEGFCR